MIRYGGLKNGWPFLIVYVPLRWNDDFIYLKKQKLLLLVRVNKYSKLTEHLLKIYREFKNSKFKCSAVFMQTCM